MNRIIFLRSNIIFIIVYISSILFSCKKDIETKPTPVKTTIYDTVFVYAKTPIINKMNVSGLKYLYVSDSSLYGSSNNSQNKQITFLTSTNDTIQMNKGTASVFRVNSDFILVSGNIKTTINGFKYAIKKEVLDKDTVKIDTTKSPITKDIYFPNNFFVRKSDGKVFFFPEPYSKLKFDLSIYDFKPYLLTTYKSFQADENQNVYFSSGGGVYKTNLAQIENEFSIQEFIPPQKNIIRFLIDKNGNCLYNVADSWTSTPIYQYKTSSNEEFDFSTAINSLGFSFHDIYNCWKGIDGEIYLMGSTTSSYYTNNAIVKITSPSTLSLVLNMGSLGNWDISDFNYGAIYPFRTIPMPEKNAILFPGLQQASLLENGKFIGSHVDYFINTLTLDPDYVMSTANYYFVFFNNSYYQVNNVYIISKDLSAGSGKTINMSNYIVSSVDSDYSNDKLIFSGFNNSSNKYVITEMDILGNLNELKIEDEVSWFIRL